LKSSDARDLIERARGAFADNGRGLYSEAAKSVATLTRQHLERYASSHHGTADRLGAPRSGHLEPAAEGTVPVHDNTGFGVSIRSPGIQRARRDLEIRPREKKALTLPLHALAYGRRAADVERTFGLTLFRPNKKGGGKHNILATNMDGKLVALYALVQRARVPKDESMIPTNTQLRQAGADGLRAGFFTQLKMRRA